MRFDQLIAGDTLDFSDEIEKYRSDEGWLMSYRLVPRFSTPPQSPILIQGVAGDGGSHHFQKSADETALWTPGGYTWFRWATKVATGVRQTLGSGAIEVLTNPALATAGFDARSHSRKMLDNIEAALLALNHNVKSYSIAGRTWLKEDIKELEAMRNKYRAEVADELNAADMAAGAPNKRVMKGRFVRP